MEQNKGFGMPTGRSRSLLACSPPASSPGRHMYYLYGIGAFNEVAFVAMLKSGIDTGVYGRGGGVWRQLPVRPHHRRVAGGDPRYRRSDDRPVSVLAYRRCCSARALSSRWRTSPPRWSPAWSLVWQWVTSSFWRVSSPLTRAIPLTAPTR